MSQVDIIRERPPAGTNIWHAFSRCRVFWIGNGQGRTPDQLKDIQTDLRKIVPQDEQDRGNDQWIDPYQPSSGGGSWLAFAGKSDVYSCEWSKDTTSPVGVLTIHLFPNQDYAEMIQAGDLLIPFMGYAEGKRDDFLITVAIVDSVTETRQATEEGVTQETVTVSARDLGKVLLGTSTVLDPAFVENVQVQNTFFNVDLYEALSQTWVGSPVERVLQILNVFYNGQDTNSQIISDQWKFPGTNSPLFSLIDIKTFVQAPMFGYCLPDVVDTAAAGNVWHLIDSMANRVINEMFFDVRDLGGAGADAIRHLEEVTKGFLSEEDAAQQQQTRDSISSDFTPPDMSDKDMQQLYKLSRGQPVFALVFRQMPYDTDTFMKLPVVEVDSTEVFHTTISKSDHDVFNLFRIRTPSLPQLVQEIVYGLKVNRKSLQKYGLRRYEGETIFPLASKQLALDFESGTNPINSLAPAVYAYYIGLLSTWHAYNERMYSGTMELRFRPDIRVGTRLRFTRWRHGKGTGIVRTITNYYVQGVHHSFHYGEGQSRTSVTLVRGVREREGNTVSNGPEANLKWTSNGSQLKYDPYIVLQEGGIR